MRIPLIDSFNIRKRKLKKLGFNSYENYLDSDLWKNLKMEVYAVKDCCDKCGSKDNLQVHHASYTFMCTPTYPKGRAKSLKLLCGNCHKEIHEIAKNENIGLVKATRKYLKVA